MNIFVCMLQCEKVRQFCLTGLSVILTLPHLPNDSAVELQFDPVDEARICLQTQPRRPVLLQVPAAPSDRGSTPTCLQTVILVWLSSLPGIQGSSWATHPEAWTCL